MSYPLCQQRIAIFCHDDYLCKLMPQKSPALMSTLQVYSCYISSFNYFRRKSSDYPLTSVQLYIKILSCKRDKHNDFTKLVQKSFNPFVDNFCIFPSGMYIFNPYGDDFIQKSIAMNNSGLVRTIWLDPKTGISATSLTK